MPSAALIFTPYIGHFINLLCFALIYLYLWLYRFNIYASFEELSRKYTCMNNFLVNGFSFRLNCDPSALYVDKEWTTFGTSRYSLLLGYLIEERYARCHLAYHKNIILMATG